MLVILTFFYDSYLTSDLYKYISLQRFGHKYIFWKNQLFGETLQHNWKRLTFHEKESFDRTEQFLTKDTFANDYRINTMKYNFFAMSRAWNLKQLCVPDFGLQ